MAADAGQADDRVNGCRSDANYWHVHGLLPSDPELQIGKDSGVPYVDFIVRVPQNSPPLKKVWHMVRCMCIRENAERMAATIQKGDFLCLKGHAVTFRKSGGATLRVGRFRRIGRKTKIEQRESKRALVIPADADDLLTETGE